MITENTRGCISESKGESGTQYVRFLFYTLQKRMKKAGRVIYEDFNT